MAKKNNGQRNDARDDTPIKRAAQEIAAARSKARNTVPNGTTMQKRVTRSSGLLSLAARSVTNEQIEEPARGAKSGRGDKEQPGTESDNEDVSDVATAKKSTGRSSKAVSDEGSSDSKATPKRSLGTKAARTSRARRGGQDTSSDGDEVPGATKKAKTRPLKRKKTVRDEAISSDDDDRSDVLSGGGVDKKNDGSSNKVRELERKLKNAEGQCY